MGTMTILITVLVLAGVGWGVSRFVSSSKVSSPALSLYWQAVKDHDSGQEGLAEKKFLQHIGMRPNHIQSYLYLAKIYKKRGHIKGEIQVCRTLMELWETGYHEFKVGEIQRRLADSLYACEAFEESFFHYASLQKGSTDQNEQEENAKTGAYVDDEVIKRIAFLLASQARYDKSLIYYDQVLSRSPKDEVCLRGRVPCFIGLQKWEEARDALLDVISQRIAQVQDYYYLGKVFQKLDDPDSARAYHAEYLQKINSEQAYDGYDALGFLMGFYYEKTGLFGEKELDFWLKVFKVALDVIYLKDEQKKELNWQRGFLEYFKNREAEEFREAIKNWSGLEGEDPSYKEVGELLADLKKYKPLVHEEAMEERYFRLKGVEAEFFDAPRVIRAADMFDVLPFESDVVSQFFDPSFFNNIIKVFQAKKKVSAADLKDLTVYQFERKVEEIIEKMSYKFERKLKSDSSGMVFHYLLKNSRNKLSLCSVYRNTGDLGEVEVKSVLNLLKNQSLIGGMIISLGSFTVKAAKIARDSDVELITGVILDEKYL
jgi:tetratricopeptide (TPR) repeat protein